MIPFDFDYYRPNTAQEAVAAFNQSASSGTETYYYGGGTEIISMARLYTIRPGAIIDIKAIPECSVFDHRDGQLIFGAALTLSQITEANAWPLLSETAGRIADHTTRGKITLGGNIAGTLPYREAVLPFLLADATAVIGGMGGYRQVPLREIFHRSLRLNPGELLAQLIVDERVVSLPFMHIKRTRHDWIDYPIVTVSALKDNQNIRFAFSGLCPFPFHSLKVEQALNQRELGYDQRIDNAIAALPDAVVGDMYGSAQYRLFVFRNTLRDMLIALER